MAARQEKYQTLDCEGALKRLLKHLQNPKKVEKVLEMLSQLVSEHFDFLSGDSLFVAFDRVMKTPGKFKTS